jgi:hypothetical protein
MNDASRDYLCEARGTKEIQWIWKMPPREIGMKDISYLPRSLRRLHSIEGKVRKTPKNNKSMVNKYA